MKYKFILLAIVIALILYNTESIKEGQISGNLSRVLSGNEDILIGVGLDYKLYQFQNPEKVWTPITGKSCCVKDITYWDNTLLGVGKYDHRLYKWERTGLNSGLWRLATDLPMEWMSTIGVWKNRLFSANLQSLFRWTNQEIVNLDSFKSRGGKKPTWEWAGGKVIKNMTEYQNQLYIVDSRKRLAVLVNGAINNYGRLQGTWKHIGHPNEALLAITTWNGKLIGIGADNHLYEWNNKKQNWFQKKTNKKLIGVVSIGYESFKRLFNPDKKVASCGDGFKLEPGEMKRCYKPFGEKLTWDSAAKKCLAEDPSRKTTLGVITSPKENNFAKSLMNAPKWIGCSDKAHEGVWKWPDGETLQKKGYSNWNRGEPNNAGKGQDFCQQYSSGKWDDMGGPHRANATLPYVCSHTTSKGMKEGFGNRKDWIELASGMREGFGAAQVSGNVVRYKGAEYRTLTGFNPNSKQAQCESSPRVIPAGWSIAPDDADSKYVIEKYPWNTHVLVVSNGKSYGGANYRKGLWGSNKLRKSGVTVSAGSCSLAILLKRGGGGGGVAAPAGGKCPGGWNQVGSMGADIGGCGLDGCNARYRHRNLQECANWCKSHKDCKSFSWAPLNGDRNHRGQKVCTRYNSDKPTGKWPGVSGKYEQVMCKPKAGGGDGNAKVGGCCFQVKGNCKTYPNMNNHSWFRDSEYGGPKPSTKGACERRLGSWKGSCANQNIQMKTNANCAPPKAGPKLPRAPKNAAAEAGARARAKYGSGRVGQAAIAAAVAAAGKGASPAAADAAAAAAARKARIPPPSDADYQAAWLATGCPSAPGGKQPLPWWKKGPEIRALNDMYAYCTLARDGKANKRQMNVCCGIGQKCKPNCQKQGKIKGAAAAAGAAARAKKAALHAAAGDHAGHSHSKHHEGEIGNCKKCPVGTYSKAGSKECIVCTKNSTNPLCKEGGKDEKSGLVCPAGTSSTGLVVSEEGKPMALGQSSGKGRPGEDLKEKCKLLNKNNEVCNPKCNNQHGRCIGGVCLCGHGYRGASCDKPPQKEILNLAEWNRELAKKKAERKKKELNIKPDPVSYGYHQHRNINHPFSDGLTDLNSDIQSLVEQVRQQKDVKRPRSFLPSEFLAWTHAIPGLLGKNHEKSSQKPIDVGIAIDDRRKIHFRQQGGIKGGNTKLGGINAQPQVIKGGAQKIAKGGDLKGANSFKRPVEGKLRGYNEGGYIMGADDRKQLPG